MDTEIKYELKCEIRRCEICQHWIEQTNKVRIIKKKYYHKSCIILYRESLHTQKPALCWNPSAPSHRPSSHLKSSAPYICLLGNNDEEH